MNRCIDQGRFLVVVVIMIIIIIIIYISRKTFKRAVFIGTLLRKILSV